MSNQPLVPVEKKHDNGSLLLGTGLVFASLILFPAVAARIGLGTGLTGAMRIALMKASGRAIGGKGADCEGSSSGYSCH